MTEIQRLLTETIESLNTREKRDNKPRFSISFIRKHPGLFIGMYVAFFATLAVMLQSETLSGSVWLLVVLFILLNGFFFFDVYPRYRYEDIDVLELPFAQALEMVRSGEIRDGKAVILLQYLQTTGLMNTPFERI